MSFYYGDGGLGCGAYPVPLDLQTGTHAIVQDPEMSGGYNAIAWPAAPRTYEAPRDLGERADGDARRRRDRDGRLETGGWT